MFILKYDQGYDEGYIDLAVSNYKEKLVEYMEQLSAKYEEYRVLYQAYHGRRSEYYKKYYEMNKEFWLNNLEALENPRHPDGLWHKIEYNNEHIFRPSGCSTEDLTGSIQAWQNEIQHKKPYSSVGSYTPNEITTIKTEYALKLAGQTSYVYEKFINWNKITDPIPVYFWDEAEPPGVDGYPANLMFIQEVKELI